MTILNKMQQKRFEYWSNVSCSQWPEEMLWFVCGFLYQYEGRETKEDAIKAIALFCSYNFAGSILDKQKKENDKIPNLAFSWPRSWYRNK